MASIIIINSSLIYIKISSIIPTTYLLFPKIYQNLLLFISKLITFQLDYFIRLLFIRMNIFVLLASLLIVVCHSEQIENNNKTKVRLSYDENLMEPVNNFMKGQLAEREITNVQILEVRRKKKYHGKKRLCNIIRAPNHQPYRLLKRLNHKMKNQTQWQKIVAEESVIYRLEDLDKLEYALDLEVIGGKTLAVVFQDGQTIFYEQGEDLLHEVGRKNICQGEGQQQIYLSMGRIVVDDDKFSLFISPECMALIHSDLSIQNLGGYDKIPFIFNAVIKNQNKNTNIYMAVGQNGLAHYVLRQGSAQVQKVSNPMITLNSTKLAIVDILQVTDLVNHALGQQVFLLLEPNFGIVRISVPRQRASTEEIQATPTAMLIQNCRYLKLHDSKVYTSCPQVVIYDPKADKMAHNVILPQLPTQLLPTDKNMVIMSHNQFQTFDPCTGVSHTGSLDGQSFHHTVYFGHNFASVDDLSVFLWKIKPMQYFLACKADKAFEGQNTLSLKISFNCDNSNQNTNRCCSKEIQLDLQIFDSSKGYHIFQILGIVLICVLSLIVASIFLIKKRRITQQYNSLIQQDSQKHKNDLSVMEDENKNKKITQTEQSIINNKEIAIELEMKD